MRYDTMLLLQALHLQKIVMPILHKKVFVQCIKIPPYMSAGKETGMEKRFKSSSIYNANS